MLPFVIIAWVFAASINWILYGGHVAINLQKDPVINPKELMSLLRDLNRNICTLIEETK